MRPSVSIIVLTCNQRDYTLSLLGTLRPWLDRNPDSELLIIDNGSTDGTADAVRRSGLVPEHKLHYIVNPRNLGVAAGRNLGLRRASKDFVLILDNDTEVTADALDGLVDYLSEHPGCGLCAPALVSPDGDVQESAKPFPGVGIKVRHLLRLGRSRSEAAAMHSGHPFYVIGACQLFRREVIRQIGLLDEAIFYGPEDADWCIRIHRAGYTIDYLPHISIIHHWQRATTRAPFSRLSRLHARSLFYFYRKHRRLW